MAQYTPFLNISKVDTNSQDNATNPKSEGWYELESTPTSILSPFSLKFYLLRKAISLDNKIAYNQTFSMLKPYPEFDTLFGDTAHLEHTYEDILPIGENSYVKSLDEDWEENKPYWLYDSDRKVFSLISNVSQFDQGPAQHPDVYEVGLEALLPHTVLYKAVYPVTFEISTFEIVDEATQADITSKIISSLYLNTNSSQVDFGLPISIEYLVDVAKNSDKRIKNITVAPISYSLYATYYDKNEDVFFDVEIDSDMSNYDPISPRRISDVIASLTKKDIVAKSILAGTTQLLVPDDTFKYHINQKYISYTDGISNITGEALIDIRRDSVTSYSLDDSSDSFIKKSYALKDNEIVSFYRPYLQATKTFLVDTHFEYVLRKDIKADSSYKLANNEYFILYTPIYDEGNTVLQGYTAYSCGPGAIISSTFDIKAQDSVSNLSNYARSRILSYFSINPTETYYETSVYNENYKTEIRNSSAIIKNVISGSNSVSIQEIDTFTIDRNDKYKFFWVLKEPTYSNDSNLKSYTLFGDFDSLNDADKSDSINTYTLREGENLFYTNESMSDIKYVSAGTTIIRNCGTESSVYTDIKNSIYYVAVDDISNDLTDSSFGFLTDENDKILPNKNGLFEVVTFTEVIPESNPLLEGLYERKSTPTAEDNPVFVVSLDTEVNSKTYYEVTFKRTSDDSFTANKYYYVLVMRKHSGEYIKDTVVEDGNTRTIYVQDDLDTGCFKEVNLYDKHTVYNPSEMGLYETVTYNNNNFVDSYPLNSSVEASKQNRFTTTNDTTILDRNILSDTDYSGINISDLNTYTSIDFKNISSLSPLAKGLLVPQYKKYYEQSESTYIEVPVSYLSNPSSENLYEVNQDNEYVLTTDTTPEIISISETADIEFLKEISTTFDTNMLGTGYFYKPSSINSNYYYTNLSERLTTQYGNDNTVNVSYLDAGTVLPELSRNSSLLNTLYNVYTNTAFPDDKSDSSIKKLSDIAAAWDQSYSFQKPFISVSEYSSDSSKIYYYDDVVKVNGVSYKCIVARTTGGNFNTNYWVKVDTSWVVYNFKEYTGEVPSSISTDFLVNKYIRVTNDDIISKAANVNNIYPALDGPLISGSNNPDLTKAYFYIPASYYSTFYSQEENSSSSSESQGSIPEPETPLVPSSITFYELDTEDKFIKLDNDLKLYRLFPASNNNVNKYGTIHIFFLPKLYRFNDFVRYNVKNYYEPKELFDRNCGTIPAWTCTALDSNSIADDITGNVGDLWASLQTNTSLTVIRNEFQSFAKGDVLSFEAKTTSENRVSWPTFSNDETILDLNSYSISYRRAGENEEEIKGLDVSDYTWRGYSSLLLNTSSESGQKLEYNHSLKLYAPESPIDPIATLNGSTYENTIFQLKNTVPNSLGTFIDVTTRDVFGNTVLNQLYAFTSFADGEYYKYNINDNSVSLYFNSDKKDSNNYNPQSISLPLGLPYGSYLLGMNMKDNINLTVEHLNILNGMTSNGFSFSYNLDSPAVNSTTSIGNMGYTFDSSYKHLLSSYVSDEQVFTGDKYDYISLNIEEDYKGYKKITLPSLISYLVNKSPYELGWYMIYDEEYVKVGEEYSEKGSDLLEEVITDIFESNTNPKEMGWYEYINSNYHVTEDTVINNTKTYYKEPDMFVRLLDVTSSLNFKIDSNTSPTTYTLLDIFKYNENPDLEDGFDTIRERIRRLDRDNEYNYMFVPSSNDLIKNPLDPRTFWNSNHIYNNFTIPQMNFDDLTFKYITTKMNR